MGKPVASYFFGIYTKIITHLINEKKSRNKYTVRK